MKTKLEIAKEIITDQIVVRLEKMIEDKSIYEEYVDYGVDNYRNFDRWTDDPLVDSGAIKNLLSEKTYISEYYWEKFGEETYEDMKSDFIEEYGVSEDSEEWSEEEFEDFGIYEEGWKEGYGENYVFIDRLLKSVLETFYIDEEYDIKWKETLEWKFVEKYSSDRIDYIVSKKGEWRDKRLERVLGIGDGIIEKDNKEYVKLLEMKPLDRENGFDYYYYFVEVGYMGVVGTFCWTDDWGVWEYYEGIRGTFDMDGSFLRGEGKHKKGVYKLLYDFLYEVRENPKKHIEGIKNNVVEL